MGRRAKACRHRVAGDRIQEAGRVADQESTPGGDGPAADAEGPGSPDSAALRPGEFGVGGGHRAPIAVEHAHGRGSQAAGRSQHDREKLVGTARSEIDLVGGKEGDDHLPNPVPGHGQVAHQRVPVRRRGRCRPAEQLPYGRAETVGAHHLFGRQPSPGGPEAESVTPAFDRVHGVPDPELDVGRRRGALGEERVEAQAAHPEATLPPSGGKPSRARSMPSRSRTATPPGISPSPHGLSRGNAAFSRTRVRMPERPRSIASTDPTGPPPTTITWASSPVRIPQP